MKTLIIYHSHEGSCRPTAKIIKQELECDSEEIKEKKPISKSAAKFFGGGYQAYTNKTPVIKKLKHKLEDYELIIIGTPNWEDTFSHPVRTFLKQNISNKKIALFCCDGKNTKQVFADIKKEIPDNEFIAEIALADPVKNKEEFDKLSNFILALQKAK